MPQIDMFSDFNQEKCTLCGDCFHKCPVLQLPIEKSIEEMKRIQARKKTEIVLQKCQSCFYCNIICPNQANPAQLILKRWNEYYKENGLPIWAKYFNTLDHPNFRSYPLSMKTLPKDEKQVLEDWKDLSKVKGNYCYPGCNVITSCYLTDTKLLEDLEIRGALDFCCGETFYRTGLFEQVKQQTKRLNKYFSKLDVKKMVILCTAGCNVFKNILPHFGANFDFPIQSYLEYLWERIKSGDLVLKKKILKNVKVTIQDSCYSKMFGSEYIEIPRKILKQLGAEIVEMEHSKECMVCCGIAGGFSPYSGYHPLKIIKATLARLREAKKTKAQIHVVYCAGCLQLFNIMRIIYPVALPVYHILELLQLSIGEKPKRREFSRALSFFLGIIIKQFPLLLSRKRYKIPKIK
ncbi:MAG: 4Fe-4S dicluster domain-containing protein [Candidatus Lokiarchaeota archaeon]|nr:4Fe-4S dicluster domain-containing protein [Candidatus Lokiarchaeota archaeon]